MEPGRVNPYSGRVTVFSPDTVTAVLHHMNDDHRDDNLLIVRAFLEPSATSAAMTALDEHGGEWAYTVAAADAPRTGRIPWSTTIGERAEIRREVVVLYDSACERLGLAPRPH